MPTSSQSHLTREEQTRDKIIAIISDTLVLLEQTPSSFALALAKTVYEAVVKEAGKKLELAVRRVFGDLVIDTFL